MIYLLEENQYISGNHPMYSNCSMYTCSGNQLLDGCFGQALLTLYLFTWWCGIAVRVSFFLARTSFRCSKLVGANEIASLPV